MTPNSPDSITKLFLTRIIPATRAKVFTAWTDPEIIKQWFAPGPARVPDASVDLRVGGSYRIHMRDDTKNASYFATGTYREIQPPDRIVFTWKWEGDMQSGEMLVTVEFKDKGDETELTLIHELLESEESRKSHEEGWIGCLDKLDRMLRK